jgi:hypothetical protein
MLMNRVNGMSKSRGRPPKTRAQRLRNAQPTKVEDKRPSTAREKPSAKRVWHSLPAIWGLWQATWGVIGPIITLVSVGFWLEPAIIIEPTASLDRSETLATQFKVTNTGHVPVYDLHFRCEYGFPLSAGNFDMTGRSFGPAAVLSPGQPITRSCADASSHDVGTPNMQITAFYKWPITGKTTSVAVYFRVVKGNDGYFLLPDQMPEGWRAALSLNGPEHY